MRVADDLRPRRRRAVPARRGRQQHVEVVGIRHRRLRDRHPARRNRAVAIGIPPLDELPFRRRVRRRHEGRLRRREARRDARAGRAHGAGAQQRDPRSDPE